MGACNSSAAAVASGGGAIVDPSNGSETPVIKKKPKGKYYITNSDGGIKEYKEKYIEGDILGQGEFGVVKKVHLKDLPESSNTSIEYYACKYLKKGVQFKDNTLYPALKPELFIGEVEMLRQLQGANYCLKLLSLYESPKVIMMITELCSGGEMMDWVSTLEDDLCTEDVSKIAYELLVAIDHCANHNIIHRDIKAENVMFQEKKNKRSELRLIDFGCSTNQKEGSGKTESGKVVDKEYHTTFAGSAFYISPEMFQHAYNSKTDVWSVGVTLYVLIAGFPSENLQKAFNILQKSKRGRLQTLPDMPPNMPSTYYDMLEDLLTYRHSVRKSAKEMLHCDFVQFHLDLLNQSKNDVGKEGEEENEEESKDAFHTEDLPGSSSKSKRNMRLSKTQSVRFTGTGKRHSVVLDYRKFERSLTTLLATILSNEEFEHLVTTLKDRYLDSKSIGENDEDGDTTTTENNDDTELGITVGLSRTEAKSNTRLGVVPIHKLKAILREESKSTEILPMIEQLKDSSSYDNYFYDIAKLNDFTIASRNAKTTVGQLDDGPDEEDDEEEVSSTAAKHGQAINIAPRNRQNNLRPSVRVDGTAGRSFMKKVKMAGMSTRF